MQTDTTSQHPSDDNAKLSADLSADSNSTTLSPQVLAVLKRHGMTTHAPDAHHLIVYAVPVPDCSKARTNLLLHWESLVAGCRVYVDHDLQYLGDDPAMLEAIGDQRQHWRQLRLDPVQGSPYESLCEVLMFLHSPSADELVLSLFDDDVPTGDSLAGDSPAGDSLESAATDTATLKTAARDAGTSDAGKPLAPLGRTLAQYADVIATPALDAAFDRCERKAMAQSIAAITRRTLGGCPVLWGDAGSGKKLLACAAAGVLHQHGFVDRVLDISGARLTAGNIYWQDADSVLVRLLDDWRQLPHTIVLLRDLDLSSSGSWISYALLSEAIDRGLRFIGIAHDAASVARFAKDKRFASRLVPIEVAQPEAKQIVAALQRHADEAGVELDPASIDMILHRSLDPQKKTPRLRIALSMLDAAITDVLWRSRHGGKRVLPDDVIAVTPPNWPAEPTESNPAGEQETE